MHLNALGFVRIPKAIQKCLPCLNVIISLGLDRSSILTKLINCHQNYVKLKSKEITNFTAGKM
jgi:hypothetical protein